MCTLLVALAPAVSAGDIKAYPLPLELTIENVQVGVKFKVENFIGINSQWNEYLGTKFSIVNSTDAPLDVTIEAGEPDPGSAREGYEPLPVEYLSWLIVEPSTLTIPASSSKEVTIYLNIPNREEFLNRKWEVWVYPRPSTTSTIQSLAAARVKFETGSVLSPEQQEQSQEQSFIPLIVGTLTVGGGTVAGMQVVKKRGGKKGPVLFEGPKGKKGPILSPGEPPRPKVLPSTKTEGQEVKKGEGGVLGGS